jgi:TatA/E family protein of Tat protein translocase
MFGTLGFGELIIIMVIVLIIFGAGRLPQIGEGIGKALKGFKKEVHDVPPAAEEEANVQGTAGQTPTPQAPMENAHAATAAQPPPPQDGPIVASKPTAPYQPGPESTPGTTAARMAALGPQQYVPPKPKTPRPVPSTASAQGGMTPQAPTMEERMAQPPPQPRAAYPPLPPGAQAKPVPKRPSAVVNKAAVARVQAQQATLRAKAAQASAPSPQDLQGLGETVGDALRTFRQAAADVRNSVDPEMRTIRAEMEAAKKEIEQSVEAAKQLPETQDDSSKQA